VRYVHNWADSAGVTHFATTNFTLTGLLANSDPDFVHTSLVPSPATLELLQSPVGWTGSWHANAYPQLVFFIEGTGKWTSSDNTTYTFKKGDIYFGEDQLIGDARTRQQEHRAYASHPRLSAVQDLGTHSRQTLLAALDARKAAIKRSLFVNTLCCPDEAAGRRALAGDLSEERR
jgi:hypothetical protein